MPDQWIVFDHLLFVLIAGNVQDIERTHLVEQNNRRLRKNSPRGCREEEEESKVNTASCGVTRLSNLAAQSLTGEAKAGSMKISGPIRTTPSKADGSLSEAANRIIPPCVPRIEKYYNDLQFIDWSLLSHADGESSTGSMYAP